MAFSISVAPWRGFRDFCLLEEISHNWKRTHTDDRVGGTRWVTTAAPYYRTRLNAPEKCTDFPFLKKKFPCHEFPLNWICWLGKFTCCLITMYCNFAKRFLMAHVAIFQLRDFQSAKWMRRFSWSSLLSSTSARSLSLSWSLQGKCHGNWRIQEATQETLEEITIEKHSRLKKIPNAMKE